MKLKEYGFVESGPDNFVAVESSLDRTAITNVPIDSTTIGMMHTHYDNYPNGDFSVNGTPMMTATIKVPSPGDVGVFLKLLRNAAANNIPLEQVYVTMISSKGNYTLKYEGSALDIPSGGSVNMLSPEDFEKKYAKYVKDFGKQRGLLKFIKDKMAVTNVALYNTRYNGKVKRYFLYGNKDKIDDETCYEN
ncbi:hypothetical protein [Nonlabens ulvanivorans]|uniref:Uncharacterized protein n=1 Tax=Nonlabens ulvanivorans TaxID=906888 RepID=A0A090WEI5_NONUL|nr:hypothetical protein [Nonlabens ulvanivorans]GAL73839.1 hypothetical protein JCM19275_2686 [Nonlabens ulvanivorans]